MKLGYYWLEEEASFQVCHTETGSALWFHYFLSIYGLPCFCCFFSRANMDKLRMLGLWPLILKWFFFFVIAYLLCWRLPSATCFPPVTGMFLLQLILLYVLSKQWSSLGAKPRWSCLRADSMPGTFWMFYKKGLQCSKIRFGGYHVAPQLKQKYLFSLA